jgi:hypothetical protein
MINIYFDIKVKSWVIFDCDSSLQISNQIYIFLFL